MLEEAVLEKSRGESKIGTTGRGIGMCYRDKVGRAHAIRVGDLYHRDTLKQRLHDIVAYKNTILAALDPAFQPLDANQILTEYIVLADRLKSNVIDTTAYLHKAHKAGRSILFEGAQGSLLDVDHGTFPYVTSSNSSGAGIHNGSGLSARAIDRMIGVVKAYTTRVGGGPFPTELHDATGEHIRQVGREFGTVTGRPRRCGWFDAVASSYGGRISGADVISVMLLDVLDGLDEVRVCEAYHIDGERVTDFPSHVEDLQKAKPIYRTLPGWKKDTTGVRKWADLPPNAQRYVEAISELMDRPVSYVSVGPDREQTIVR
jgi:adenylosuccinate synthase